MSNVNLRIANIGGQTTTRIWMSPHGTLTFRNDSPQDLVVSWGNPPTDALQDKNGPVTGPVNVGADDSYTCWIRPGFTGEFKYSARIDGAALEDPIIIVG